MTSPPMRYAVVTSHHRGYASRFVGQASQRGTHRADLAAVILCLNRPTDPHRRKRQRLRQLRKALRIGVIGTLNGVRMRQWYGRQLAERLDNPDIADVCREHGIPLLEIPTFRDADAQARLRELDLDVAVSMGNGYIPRSFFTIPRLGMLNVHHELLPEYRGAQSVLWQIHDGSRVTGYSIHEMTERIDAGRVLYRETVPIAFRDSLRETVVESSARVQLRSIEGLARTLDDLEGLRATARPSEGGRSFTTPDTRALLRIYRQFRRLRREAPDVVARESRA